MLSQDNILAVLIFVSPFFFTFPWVNKWKNNKNDIEKFTFEVESSCNQNKNTRASILITNIHENFMCISPAHSKRTCRSIQLLLLLLFLRLPLCHTTAKFITMNNGFSFREIEKTNKINFLVDLHAVTICICTMVDWDYLRETFARTH